MSNKGCDALKAVTLSDKSSWRDLRKPPNFMTSCFDFSPWSFIFVFFKLERVCWFFQLKSLVSMCAYVLGENGGSGSPGGRGERVCLGKRCKEFSFSWYAFEHLEMNPVFPGSSRKR